MSARTRSSTRRQAIQVQEDSETSEPENNPEQSLNLEEKEQEIWDEIRDEHYDIIEQLPLTIHRQLTLLHQLDVQSREYSENLLPTIKQYIDLRQRLASKGSLPHHSTKEATLNLSPQPNPSADRAKSPHQPQIHITHPDTDATPSGCGVSVSSSIGGKAKSRSIPTTTCGMLSHIAWLSEEYLRTSREKVNIAQTAHDSVDRHIRLLDQFIKEQEASLGPEPNAPVMLSMSELAVPKWSRSTRVSMSPMLDEEEDQNGRPTHLSEHEASTSASSKRRPPKGRKSKEKEKEKDEHGDVPPLKITLPPPQLDVSYNEPTWCYCNTISFGEMIGCDDPECKYEWFHLECVGLNEVPEDDEWYCRECSQRREVKNRRK